MERYNGHANKYTWIASIYMDLQYFYDFIQGMEGVREILVDPEEFRKYQEAQLVEAIKNYYYEEVGKVEGFTREILMLGMSQIDYLELAKDLLDDCE